MFYEKAVVGHYGQSGLWQSLGRYAGRYSPDVLFDFDARHKGLLESAVRGVTAVDKLKDGDKVLIAEGCTHHRQCDDIGTVKIPRWLKEYTGKDISIETSSGRDFPEDLSPYALVIHCGGCMLNGREVGYRMKTAADQAVPITNYGIAIAYMKGILRRSLSVFPDLQELLPDD